ncbi:cytoplasmic protein [Leptolyngbya boryana NIES-2135]|jgi:hypothetical protein|uniref:Cytoplasmic protein n=1 Tax=Leptolyngbya boryana NIES-2135 TaxID=1973484 RepID=A0A1Z4JGI3_LEPBY|nr:MULTISPECIES: DUF1828 domain-containing protein [Leptolyngbya]BAY55841.1 cytoplasmic protein [Leptolyngbya boryana NIES-2135]MBD2368852.1 DUF1828 domain-containing protein [Leptolyngbya sp. FACHB-161]MBD2375280.1 DUF1828 domain-containing protein [Leptolyngbya sp. FACHB-238]MBD2399698.1 DUF1828 domain-containing protein [Leptolyngbya sp. FACHB-239]MBD2405904.1 DUF1828 domain-containing protein [Leptolyngbya sp. FACHB-402]
MNTNILEANFQQRFSEKVKLFEDGENRFKVFTPFLFDDGDHLSIVLKKERDRWLLSDEGSTYMHLTLTIDESDLFEGTREKIITRTLSSMNVLDREGELIAEVNEEEYGEALYSFIQALLKIADISYLSRERVQSTFLEDFEEMILEVVPEHRVEFKWYDRQQDEKRLYQVDCHVNHMQRPLFIYALSNDDRVTNATIAIYKFREWGLDFRPVGIFDNQEIISRKVLSRFTEVCDRQYVDIANNKQRIQENLKEMIEAGR